MLTVLYSNSNEIVHLIQSVCGFHVSPLGCIDEDEGVADLLVFDILFYGKPEHDWTIPELLRRRPEWGWQILPLLKSQVHRTFLFAIDWYSMVYIKELDVIRFVPAVVPPVRMKDRFCLLATSSLTFMMRQKIKKVVEPLTYARDISVRLSDKLNRPISLGTPAYFRELTEKMEDLLVELMTEKEQCDLVNSFNHCLMNEDD